ncbi:TPA: carbonate dehydratase, partial [Mannheimia haemolytica]|nr:carbonate dehydratase [Mannheimia haemolytica]
GVMATSRETLEITYRNAIAKITTEANEKIVLNDEN